MRRLVIFALGLTLLFSAALLVGDSSAPVVTTRDKAFYASPSQVSFVRPGVTLQILSHSIASDGTVKARFRITDSRGLGLDRLGVETPGTVTVRLMIAHIGKGVTRYVSYNNSATSGLPGTDANGTFESHGKGEYTYTFTTKLPANYPKDVTHTIGGQASRNLNEFEMGNWVDNTVYHFVPDGSKVTYVRDIVKTATCNESCHDPISAHGSRRKMEYCILCHTPDNFANGISFDMPVMIHRIHMGSELPSVKAGKPYRIGNTDFSKVVFPAGPKNCEVCHDTKSGAAQADAHLKNPSRSACGSCHDDVNFATGAGHLDLPQVSDSQCANCHIPKGEVEFDASIAGAHMDNRFSKDLPGTVFELLQVFDGTPGTAPTVSFRVKDKQGNVIPPSQMDRLSLVLAGPATDFKTYFAEDVRRASGPDGGPYFWTFANKIPADAKGTWAIGAEGYKIVRILAGTKKEQQVRDAGENKTIYFSVDGTPVKARRQVVAIEKCNDCHFKLEAHGRNRNTIDECAKCHNTERTETGRPAAAGRPMSINLKTMIHGIHAGARRQGGYVMYGSTGTKYDYSGVGYPGDLRNCTKCHINGTEQVPVSPDAAAVNDPNAPVSPVGPATAACTACHNATYVYSHALANTNAVGESCGACHGATSDFSVNKVHAR